MLLRDNPATRIAWKIDGIHRLHAQNIAGIHQKYGLYPGQSRILFTIAEMNGSTQREIADRLNITPASLAVSIKRLQRAGAVEKIADENDLRNNLIFLTEKGTKIMEESLSEFISFDDSLIKGFSQEELKQLDAFLSRVDSNLKEAKNLNA